MGESLVKDKASKKSEKKDKKKREAKEMNAEVTEKAVTEVAAVDDSKKKKKKKKSEEHESEKPAKKAKTEPEVSEKAKSGKSKKSQAEPVTDAPEPSKKDKKDKKKAKEHDTSADKHAASGVAVKAGSSKKGGIRKDFYVESASVKARAAAADTKWHKDNTVTVECPEGKEYRPVLSWSEAAESVPTNVLKVCTAFPSPTPIQSQAWPVCLSGRDMIGIAKTGSGKTIAFGVPSVVHALDQAPVTRKAHERGPIVLVLSPTRELAMQTAEVYNKIALNTGIVCACIYGGVPKEQQRRETQNGVHVIIATPGRLLNLMEEEVFNFTRVTYFVLDEADRMLDMGFEPDIRRIVAAIPAKEGARQTVMFSATWPKEIRELAHEFLSNPVRVTIGSQDLSASDSIKQIVEVIDAKEKDKRLIQLMGKYHNKSNRVLVFVLYKKEAPRVERLLSSKGYKVGAVHGDMSQYDRTQAVEYFKAGSQPVLVATDVCARGLDIPDVEVVINYSFPLTVEDYVHRIGRTGRGGKTGLAHTLFTLADKTLAGPLSDVLKEAGTDVPAALSAFGYAPTKKKEHKMYGAHYKADDDMPTKKATKISFD